MGDGVVTVLYRACGAPTLGNPVRGAMTEGTSSAGGRRRPEAPTGGHGSDPAHANTARASPHAPGRIECARTSQSTASTRSRTDR